MYSSCSVPNNNCSCNAELGFIVKCVWVVITIVMERDNAEITIQRIFKEHFLFVLTNFDGQEACHSIKIHLDG